MLQNLQIAKYRRIGTPGLQLRKLTDVNYFVGENGSGKSSILQAIYSFYQGKVFPGLAIEHDPQAMKCHTKRQQSDYEAIYINQDTLALMGYNQNRQRNPQELNDHLLRHYNYLEWTLYISSFKERNHKTRGEGLQYQTYFETLLESLPQDKFYLFLVEEPENFLHPKWEKEIPLIYKHLTQKYPCQFFIATHSPYLVSAAGEITEGELQESIKRKKNYRPSQKAFLIKDGQTSTKSGRVGFSTNKQFQVGSDGYWGKKVSYVAANLLGAGLSDFVSSVEPHYTSDAPYLIFCEGEGKIEDAAIYNRIFWDHKPRLLFVSSKGVTETQWSFKILEEIKNGLSGNFRTLMLRDRDHEFPHKDDIENYIKDNPSHRVLEHRAIENYIYNRETAKLWLKKYGLELPGHLADKIKKIERRIEGDTRGGVRGNHYKEWLSDVFYEVYMYKEQSEIKKVKAARKGGDKRTRKRITESSGFIWELVSTITPKTQTYQDLCKDLFRGDYC
jgi:predicted ATPase